MSSSDRKEKYTLEFGNFYGKWSIEFNPAMRDFVIRQVKKINLWPRDVTRICIRGCCQQILNRTSGYYELPIKEYQIIPTEVFNEYAGAVLVKLDIGNNNLIFTVSKCSYGPGDFKKWDDNESHEAISSFPDICNNETILMEVRRRI